MVRSEGGLGHLRGIPQQELECVMQNVPSTWSTLCQVTLGQHAQCFPIHAKLGEVDGWELKLSFEPTEEGRDILPRP